MLYQPNQRVRLNLAGLTVNGVTFHAAVTDALGTIIRGSSENPPAYLIELVFSFKGLKEIEVTREAEDRWVELLLTGAGRMIGSPDCTPGYYNNEGREPGRAAKLNVGHPAGPMAYFKYIDGWRNSGQFEGLQFR